MMCRNPCAVIKTRLQEMIPGVQAFLDVDALGNTKLRDFEHVDISNVVLVFMTKGFFKSGPCAREIMRAVLLGKPIVAVLETEESKGALTEDECRGIMTTTNDDGTNWVTEPKLRAGNHFYLHDQVKEWAERWGRPDLQAPTVEEVIDAVFELPPVNW